MKFGPVATPEALGAILAHSLKVADGQIRKGTVLEAAHLSALEAAGHASVIAARLEAGDVPEDEAAARVAAALCGAGIEAGPAFTGRVNIFAQEAGIAVIDDALIGEINRLSEALTVATVTPYARLAAGDGAGDGRRQRVSAGRLHRGRS